MTADRDAFLRAICDTPDDDAPRLVFADWLDEHGEPARAEFIRTQIACATVDDAALLARSRRCGVLTDPPSQPWIDHVPGGCVLFRRGLIAGVVMDVAAYLATDPAAWALVPVEQLWLTDRDGVGAALAGRPELARLRTLCLQEWSADALRPLLTGCPHLAGLRALRVGTPYDDAEAFRALAPTVRLPGLDSLHLDLHGGDATGWEPFLRSCPPLRRLILSAYFEGEIPDEQYDALFGDWLADTHHAASLEHLCVRIHVNTIEHRVFYRGTPPAALLASPRLRHASLDAQDLLVLADLPSWGSLRSLEVGQDTHPRVGADEFGADPRAASLRSLRLGRWDFTRPPPALTGLRELAVTFWEEGPMPLALAGPYVPNLRRLDVFGAVGTNDLACLAATPMPQLRQLRFGFHRLDADWSPLARPADLSALATLVCDGFGPDAEAVRRLAESPGLPSLSLITGVPQEGTVVIAGGVARPVRPDVLPLDIDWWEMYPDADDCE